MLSVRNKRFIGTALLIAVLCAAALLSAALLTSTRAAAETATHTADVWKPQTDCAYRYFSYPTAIYADGNGFTVADGSAAIAFSSGGKEKSAADLGVSAPVTVLIPYNAAENIYIILADGNLYSTDADAIPNDPDNSLTYSDCIVRGNMLYAAADNAIYGVSLADEQEKTPQNLYTHGSAVQKIAADEHGLYFTTANAYNRYQSDIFFLPFSALQNAAENTARVYYTAADEILSLEGREKGVIARTRDKIVAYAVTGTDENNGALAQEHSVACRDAVAISAHEDTVYGISQDKSIFKIVDFSERTEILASAYDELGFYRANAGIASRKQMVAVADERNDRVQIVGEEGIVSLDVTRPKAVAIDYERRIYVAHDNRISVYADRSVARTLSAPIGITLTDLQIDSYNNIFALGNNRQVYRFAADGTSFDTTDMPSDVRAISCSPTNDSLFFVTADNKIMRRHDNAQAQIATSTADIQALCVDLNNSVYALTTEGKIVKYHNDSNGKYTAPQEFALIAPFVNATKIVMNTVAFGQDVAFADSATLTYGDLLVSDTGAHAVKRVSGELLEVNKGFSLSDAPNADDVPWDTAQGAEEIVWTVAACDVYAQAAEIVPVAKLYGNMRVIVPHYDPAASFQLIITDNLQGIDKPPVVGYIRNVFLKSKLPYAAPPTDSCYSFLSNTAVYRFPSYNSPKITDTVARNTKFELMRFVYSDNTYGYTDNLTTPAVWYRVRYCENDVTIDGYIPCDSISMRGENPDDRNIYPRTNAKVIKTATLYESVNGEMIEVTDAPYAPLSVGTKVEVVGAFDSSEKYTLIKYYHEGLGTVQFYVLTKTLQYHGVNKVVVIAAVLITLTAVLAAILIARFLYVKRTRKLSDPKE